MSPTDAPSHRLASFLVEQLRASVPVALELEGDGADVVVRFELPEGRSDMAAVLDEDDGTPFDERLVTATRAILGHVQDAAVTASSQPWPGTGATLPLPQAEVIDGFLRSWFGDRETPSLVLGAIETNTLRA